MSKFVACVLFLSAVVMSGAAVASADCGFQWDPATGQFVNVCGDNGGPGQCGYNWDPTTGQYIYTCS